MIQTITKLLNEIKLLSPFRPMLQPLRLTRLMEKVDVIETAKAHRRII